MAGGLTELLEAIDPQRTLDHIARRVDEALNAFHPSAIQIREWAQFQKCLSDFHRHVEVVVGGLDRPVDVDDDFYWCRCVPLLKSAYGEAGDKAAFEMVRTGTEGGLLRVLRDLGRGLVDYYAKNGISGWIWRFWNGLSTDEKMSAADEYVRRFGHLLPSELTEGGAWRIRAELPKVLREHPRLMQHLRRIGRG